LTKKENIFNNIFNEINVGLFHRNKNKKPFFSLTEKTKRRTPSFEFYRGASKFKAGWLG